MAEPAPASSAPNNAAAQAPSGQNNSSSSSGNNPPTAPGTNRGIPYYEKLRRELRDTLQKKRLMDKSMAQLEDQIYRIEQSYLEETTAGNIIKGFDNYIKGSSSSTGFSAGGLSTLGLGGGAGAGTRRKTAVVESERVFSRSSAGYLRDSPTPSSAQTTPSHAPTPSSLYNGASGRENASGGGTGPGSASGSVKGGGSSKNKKKAASAASSGRNGEDVDGEEEKPPVKRLKITYSRE